MILDSPDYQDVEALYSGSRTLVYRGIRKSDRQSVIIKILSNPNPTFNELVQFRNQYTITRDLQHPHIVQPLALERYGNGYALIMPDLGEISLSDYWQIGDRTLKDFLQVAIPLTEALHYLNQHNIIHKDIKPANILIHPETQHITLIDFSIASLLPKEQQQLIHPQVLEGTLSYISPEQTGRMNRGIDYRTDFYSLGITFWELLTGELPFYSTDPMELVHCHLAKTPQPLDINRTGDGQEIPAVISQIVLKLIAKNAEDRYQSALGIQRDLEQCLHQLEYVGKITGFEIGQRDICDRFIIPEKLYGREIAVQTLLDTFARVSEQGTEMMLVAGFSGIGKTALINETHKPITKKNGYFIKGKFDQFQRNIPLSAFVQGLQDLMMQILSESDAQLNHWKTEILKAVGDNGQVLIDVIPELEQIIGKQSPAPELSGIAAQNRFNLLFEKFITLFAHPDHPLVLVLDDLQWVDSASLQLIKTLMNSNLCLLLLGAYRDNEVSPVHPFILLVEDLKNQSKTVTTLTLEPLDFRDLNQWIADTLQCSINPSKPLTQFIQRKTKGNPFFTTQFLKILYEDNHITFNYDRGHWEADLVAINDLSLTDDVVEFMSQKLQKLPNALQSILKIASCIGHSFDLSTLITVTNHLKINTLQSLWKIVQEGLIILPDKSYKFQINLNLLEDPEDPLFFPSLQEVNTGHCRFLHDRVQQAAYALIPDREKPGIHYQIGKLLLDQTPLEERREHVFTIVNQLNYGILFISDQQEKDQLAQLNLIACRKARSGAAHQAVKEYAEIGLKLLSASGWTRTYALTLELHEFAAESSAILADYQSMDQWINQVIHRAKKWADKLDSHIIKMQALTTQNLLLEAIAYGESLLQQLGVSFPQEVTPEILNQEIQEINEIISDRTLEELLKLPPMVDADKLAMMKIAVRMIPACYIASSPLFPLLACLQTKLSLQYGNSTISSTGYADYGIFVLTFQDDVATSNLFSQLAYQLAEQETDKNIRAVTFVPVGLYLHHYQFHLRESLPIFQAGYQAALEVGKLEYMGMHSQGICVNSYWSTCSLVDLESQVQAYIEMSKNLKLTLTAKYCTVIGDTIQFLLNKPSEITLKFPENKEKKISLIWGIDSQDKTGKFYIYLHRATLAFMLEKLELAHSDILNAKEYKAGGMASICEAGYYLYHSLILLSRYSEFSSEKDEILEQVQQNQKRLELWSAHAPMNFLHKWQLVEAEKHRVLGKNYQAGDYYDRAISGAREQKYLQEEALGNELAAKFYLNWGKDKVATAYMQEAYYGYARWGAQVKTEQLAADYVQLLRPILNSSHSILESDRVSKTHAKFSTLSTTSPVLDLISVIKASRSISESIELNTLLGKLMHIVLENAGADTGGLILHQSENWQTVAYYTQSSCQIHRSRLEETERLPQSIINTVKRTQKPILINNLGRENNFLKDPYWDDFSPKSLCCIPMFYKQQLMGILYLENNFSTDAFTPERIDTLNLLTAQAVICLENAQLYQRLEESNQTLENKVSQRTEELEEKNRHLQETLEELQRTQNQLIHAEKMLSLGQMVAGIAHEINNPISFIGSNVAHAREYLKNLLDLIKVYQEEYPNPTVRLQGKLEESDLLFVQDDFYKLLRSMQVGSDRIRQIVLGLRNFSRLDESELKKVNIHEGLDNTLMILQHRFHASEDRKEIQVVKVYGELPLVYCYASQLNQVFLQILTNAIDVFDTVKMVCCPKIQMRTEQVNSQRVRISIADNGPGIREGDRQKIFDPFFTTKPVGRGTGLGLSMSYQIITEQHCGELHCYSNLGKGTEFVIEIPVH